MLIPGMPYPSAMAGRPPQRQRTSFGERLALARERAGFTQLQLAQRLGVKQPSITHWEYEPVALKPEQLRTIADVLDVTTDFLVGREDKATKRAGAPGKLRDIFERAHQLPRHQQNKIIDFVQAYVNQYNKAS